MKTLNQVSFAIILGSLILAACAGGGGNSGVSPAQQTADALFALVTLNPPTPAGGSQIADDDYVGIFEQAWAIINENYVRDNFNGVDWDAVHDEYLPLFEAVETQEEHWALMSDFVRELNDDHSRFVPPANMAAEFGVDTEDSAEARPWTGLDLWPAKEDEQLIVWCVSPASSASAAGLVRGDVIVAIDGVPVTKSDADWASADYRAAIFANEGNSEVTLTVLRGTTTPEDVTLQTGMYPGCENSGYSLINDDPRIGYIRIPDYDGDAASLVMAAIREMESAAPLDGLILDQRHNPGGNSDNTVSIFAEGIVGTVGYLREDRARTLYRIRGPVEWNETTPVVVLTDGNSHSAADYFPAAMKELGRATIIGMPSAGNTEGITGFSLPDGTLIRLAVQALLLNDGSSIEGTGVIPDIVVPLGDFGLRQTPYDIQLQAALDFLLGNEIIGAEPTEVIE
jgi:C-terminal peptidase prc